MMSRWRQPVFPTAHPLEGRVRELESKLTNAQHTIIELMPEEFSRLLGSFYECESTADFHRWKDRIAERIAELVAENSTMDYLGTQRANCPLCGRQTLGPFAHGFVIPNGLIMHLTGYGNAIHCSITAAAFDLGRTFIERRYGDAERAAKKAADEEKARLTEARRKTDTLYKVHPTEPPQLIDEGYHSWFGGNRDTERIEWAEARVQSLGFVKLVEGNVQSLEQQRADYVIYADIRSQKKITFNVFRLPITKGKKIWESNFDLPDSFKHGIQDKFETRLKEALERFRRR